MTANVEVVRKTTTEYRIVPRPGHTLDEVVRLIGTDEVYFEGYGRKPGTVVTRADWEVIATYEVAEVFTEETVRELPGPTRGSHDR